MKLKRPIIYVGVDRKTLRNFKETAKSTEKEVFGFAMGYPVRENEFRIDFIWIPEDWAKYSTSCSVDPPSYWFEAATKAAKDLGMYVIGTIHSHPLDDHPHPQYQQACPSETDWDYHVYYPLEGICALSRNKKGIISARVRWWPQVPPVRARLC